MSRPDDFPKLEVLIAASVRALKNLGGSGSNEEIHDEVVNVLQPSDSVVDFPHKDEGKTHLVYMLHWARTFLKKVGAADNTERGVWTLTPKGRAMTDDEIAGIARKVRTEDAARRRQASPVSSEEGTIENQDDADWTEELLGVLGTMSPDAFERLCQRVLRESGFTKVEVTGKSGDGGIDGIGILRVRLVSFQVLFQCKRWKGSVGSSVVRDFRGAMVGRADKGLIMTTGNFTAEARREATRDGAPAIDLVDGDDLCVLLKELRLGVNVRQVEEISIDPSVFYAI